MRLAIRIFLYGILSLVIALWLLGLFKSDYLKAPLAAWIQQQTGLPLTIGRLEFNPFYPNVLLAERIQLGDDIQAEKLYIEIASGSWFERRIEVAMDLIAPQIETGLRAIPPLVAAATADHPRSEYRSADPGDRSGHPDWRQFPPG